MQVCPCKALHNTPQSKNARSNKTKNVNLSLIAVLHFNTATILEFCARIISPFHRKVYEELTD